MIVSDLGATVEYDCGAGRVLAPLLLDSRGDFDLAGVFMRALLVSAEGTLGLFRAPRLAGSSLSYAGEVFELALRLLGPLLLGLGFVSLRSRVRG